MIYYSSTNPSPAQLRSLRILTDITQLQPEVEINGILATETDREDLEDKINACQKYKSTTQTFVDGSAVATISAAVKDNTVLWYVIFSWGIDMESELNPTQNYYFIEETL